jgi:hypothetical protein
MVSGFSCISERVLRMQGEYAVSRSGSNQSSDQEVPILSGYRVVLGLGMVVDVNGFPAVQSRES